MRISDWSSDVCSSDLQVERDKGVAGAFDLADQHRQFAFVQQQFAGARGVGDFVGRRLLEWREMRADQPGFTVLDDDIGFGALCTAGTQALDLPALAHETGLVAPFIKKLQPGGAVTGKYSIGPGRRSG